LPWLAVALFPDPRHVGGSKGCSKLAQLEGHGVPRPTCKMRIRAGLLPGFIDCNTPGPVPERLPSRVVLLCLGQAPPVFENTKILMASTTSSHPWQWSNATDWLVQPLSAPPCFLEYGNLLSLWRDQGQVPWYTLLFSWNIQSPRP
jgi:hypothetical protein